MHLANWLINTDWHDSCRSFVSKFLQLAFEATKVSLETPENKNEWYESINEIFQNEVQNL